MIEVTIYILLGVICFAVSALIIRKGRDDYALLVFNAIYFIMFAFYPINLVIFGESVLRQKYIFERFGYGDTATALVLLVCYLLFVAGYFFAEKHKRLKTRQRKVNIERNIFVVRLVIAFSFIGLIGLTYHIIQTGGIFKSIEMASCVRGSTCGLDGDFVFLRQLQGFLVTAFMLYWVSYWSQNALNKKKSAIANIILLALSILFIFYALSTWGRREFLYPVFMLFIVASISGNLKPKIITNLLLMVVIWWGLSFDSSTSFLHSQEIATQEIATQEIAFIYLKTVYFQTLQGIGDSFMHFIAMENADLWQFGFSTDLLELPYQFLPSRLLGFERADVMRDEITVYMLGHQLELGHSGEEPPGLHGYIITNFSHYGLYVFFFIFGAIFNRLHQIIQPMRKSDMVGQLVYIMAFVMVFEFMREGSLALVLKSRLSWMIMILFIINVNIFHNKNIKGQV